MFSEEFRAASRSKAAAFKWLDTHRGGPHLLSALHRACESAGSDTTAAVKFVSAICDAGLDALELLPSHESGPSMTLAEVSLLRPAVLAALLAKNGKNRGHLR